MKIMKPEKLLSTFGKRFVFMATLFILGTSNPRVVADKRLVTEQNPQSEKASGETSLEQLKINDVVARLIRYEVKQDYLEQFRRTLNEYVMHANAVESNIMAEAYYEQQYHNTVWLIERWKNEIELDRFPKVKKIEPAVTAGHQIHREQNIIHSYEVSKISTL